MLMGWYKLTVDIIHPEKGLQRTVNKRVFRGTDLQNAVMEWVWNAYPVHITVEPYTKEEV